jgi:hypothetical protein
MAIVQLVKQPGRRRDSKIGRDAFHDYLSLHKHTEARLTSFGAGSEGVNQYAYQLPPVLISQSCPYKYQL